MGYKNVIRYESTQDESSLHIRNWLGKDLFQRFTKNFGDDLIVNGAQAYGSQLCHSRRIQDFKKEKKLCIVPIDWKTEDRNNSIISRKILGPTMDQNLW